MHNRILHTGSLMLTTTAALLLVTCVFAEDVPWPPEPADPDIVTSMIKQPLPARFCLSEDVHDAVRNAFDAALEARFQTTLPTRVPLVMPTQTEGLIERLIAEGRLSLLTLMKTDSTDLFFGVNESGRFGVHFDATSLMVRE